MEIEFVCCPKCHNKNWDDVPDSENKNSTKYRCFRCGYFMHLGSCSKCKTDKAWIQTAGIKREGGHRPWYRYECRGCGRIIGILIQSV